LALVFLIAHNKLLKIVSVFSDYTKLLTQNKLYLFLLTITAPKPSSKNVAGSVTGITPVLRAVKSSLAVRMKTAM
jgi:hypothetical protein